MRVVLAVVLVFCSLPMRAQDAWADLLARAERERKPIVVFFRTTACARCDDVERVTVPHPTIQRRLPNVVFAVLPGVEPSVAFYDRAGTPRVRWPFVPDTMNLGIILDSVIAVAPQFERAVQLYEEGSPGDGELAAAAGLARMKRFTDARAAVLRARELGVATELADSVATAIEALQCPAEPESAPRGTLHPKAPGEEAGELFWVRMLSPAAGPVDGAVRVSLNVRAPAAHPVRRVMVFWNDVDRATLTAAPWQTVVRIPRGEAGVLRAVAELDDGRTAEDAVLLNAYGGADAMNVQLIELPVTVLRRDGGTPEVTPDRITVREGRKVRPVEAVAQASETPLTIGLLIDMSGSMQKTLPDVQEAAIRFLETLLRPGDRTFLVAFETEAWLLQPATEDVARLRRQIMRMRPGGETALHDALVLSLQQFAGIKGRRALIVFSDGRDGTSQHRASDVSELSRRMNVPVHAIEAISDQPTDGELMRVALATGGTAQTLERLSDLPSLYAKIQAALRGQVIVFIRVDAPARGVEWRKVTVEVQGSDLEVYAPEGYYATW